MVEYPSPLRRLAHLSAASQTTNLAVVSTWQKAPDKKNMVTQTECMPRNMPIQAAGCRECLSLLLLVDGTGYTSCMSCEQVDAVNLW